MLLLSAKSSLPLDDTQRRTLTGRSTTDINVHTVTIATTSSPDILFDSPDEFHLLFLLFTWSLEGKFLSFDGDG